MQEVKTTQITRRCKSCGKKLRDSVRVDGKDVDVTDRTYCFECRPGRKNRKSKKKKKIKVKKAVKRDIDVIEEVAEKKVKTRIRFCCKCDEPFNVDKDSRQRKSCPECYSARITIIRVEKKDFSRLCVDYKGGSCLVCGYNICLRSLCFHHLDPSTKSFNISTGHKYDWAVNCDEMDKCVLICANCHGEVHSGLIEMGRLIQLENDRILSPKS